MLLVRYCKYLKRSFGNGGIYMYCLNFSVFLNIKVYNFMVYLNLYNDDKKCYVWG